MTSLPLVTKSSSKLSWWNDLTAGMVVFFVALPLCLGIALASGAPIIAGVLSGIVGGILVGALSGSHTSVSGPAAGLTAVISAQIISLGAFDVFLTAIIIAGCIQIIMGLLRFGYIAAFFPSSVIKGLLASIGTILILKQIPHLVGLDMDYEGDMAFFQPDHENTFSELGKMFAQFHVGALIVGIFSLALIIGADRISFIKKFGIPSPLIVVVLGTLMTWALPYLGETFILGADHRVQVPVISNSRQIFSLFTWPNLGSFFNLNVLIAGFTIAIVASLETLLNLEAIDKIDPYQRKSPPNRELFAQGIGNVFIGFIGGLPVTSVVVRSSVNINANAKSKMSAIIHGLMLAIAVIAFPSMLNAIPLSSLAAVLIVTGFKLVNPKIFRHAWSQGINQFLPLLVTYVAIIFTDLLIGVLIGLAVSILFILKANLKFPNRVIIENHLSGKIRRILLTKQVSFLNRASLSETLEKIPPGTQVIVDASETEYIDADMLDLILDFKNDRAPQREIALSLVGFKDSYVMKNSIEFVDYSTYELQQNATPDQVLTMLIDGNQRVLEGRRIKRDLNKQISGTASGQYPLAAILSCIDSRLPVELVFDLGIGDVFSMRMAGNIVSEKVLGGLEFACAVSGAKLILVMGHTRCGAVSAAVDAFFGQTPVHEKYDCKHLGSILNEMKKVIEKTWPKIKNDDDIDKNHFLSSVILQNVLGTIHNIKTSSPVLARLVDEGKIGIVGCIYDVTTGSAKFLHTDLIAKYENSSPYLHSPEYIENYLKNPSSLVVS